jgi:DNA-binding NtrC family response regulator
VANVLVIDDDPAVRLTMEVVLKRGSHSVVLTDNGRKGLRLLQTGQFDLLIVDLFMPDMDGLEIVAQVKKSSPELPIIVASGHYTGAGPAPDFLQMATKLGAVYSLQKPFRPAELLTAVAKCLDQPASTAGSPNVTHGNASSGS